MNPECGIEVQKKYFRSVMSTLTQKLNNIDKKAALSAGLFLVKTAAVYAVWKAFTYAMEHIPALIPKWNAFRDDVGALLAKITGFFVVDVFGYPGKAIGRVLHVDGTPGIFIGNSCIGISAMAIFAGLILVYPGSWKHKAWYIPLGMVLVQASNVFRLAGLAIMQKYSSEAFVQFNHGYTYVIITYSFIFFLVVFWFNKLSHKK